MKKLLYLAFILPLIATNAFADDDEETFASCAGSSDNDDCTHINEAATRFGVIEADNITQDVLINNLEDDLANIELTPGPVGPAGSQGEIGPIGPQGPAGQDGADADTTGLQLQIDALGVRITTLEALHLPPDPDPDPDPPAVGDCTLAALVIDSSIVCGGASVTVSATGNLWFDVTVTTSGGGAANDWKATSYRVGDSGPFTCENHADYTASGTFTETFNAVAPANIGTFHVYLVAYRNDDCSGGSSTAFVMASAVTTVDTTPPATELVLFEFSTVSYTGADGVITAQLIEVGDDGSEFSGSIFVASSSLQLRGGGADANALGGPYVHFGADLSIYNTAFLSFDYRESGNQEPDDMIEVYVSSDGGANWVLIKTWADDQGNSFQPFNFDISDYISPLTRIAVVEKYDSNGESFFIDNLAITTIMAQ